MEKMCAFLSKTNNQVINLPSDHYVDGSVMPVFKCYAKIKVNLGEMDIHN